MAHGWNDQSWGDWNDRRGKGAGKGGGHWAPAHDPTNFEIPRFLSRMGSRALEGSCLFLDTRDQRIVSPFQGYSPLEIAENSNSSINVLVERGLMMKPNNGFYVNLFTVMTLQVFRITLCISVDTAQGCNCAS